MGFSQLHAPASKDIGYCARARGAGVFSAAALAVALILTGCANGQTSTEPDDEQQAATEADTTHEDNPDTSIPSPSEGHTDDETPEATEEAETTDQAEPVELPGGGDTLFPDRRFVALYGSPGAPELGALGQQDVDSAVERIEAKAEDYQQHSEEPVQPAFEIITTIASQEPGYGGDYTNPVEPETIRPWVEAAADAEVYVVLDLQPGRADFLSQAQMYEEFLTEPHVGLALDPEWRITDHQVHGNQIGSVEAAEINAVSDWLAELTAEHDLPQKMLIVHQFQHAMIQNREDIDTSHEELAITLHADGHGGPELKFATWDALLEDLDDEIWPAWKNFHEQDTPTFTPEETYDVEPTPWFVSYQ